MGVVDGLWALRMYRVLLVAVMAATLLLGSGVGTAAAAGRAVSPVPGSANRRH